MVYSRETFLFDNWMGLKGFGRAQRIQFFEVYGMKTSFSVRLYSRHFDTEKEIARILLYKEKPVEKEDGASKYPDLCGCE